ncbi:MAG: hypothetical protein QXV98_02065, partial [Thermofilaceae archaeon]
MMGRSIHFAIALLAIFSASLLLPVLAAPEINIDGDVSDWDAAGIQPAYVDKLGDTQPWSKDPKIVGVGSTAEPSEKVEANDKCRDLKAIYFYADEDWIYIRLDVNELYEGWCVPSQKYHEERPVAYPYPNVSAYHIYFRVPGAVISPQSSAAGASDTSFGDYAWHFNVQFDAACYPDGTYAAPFLQWPDWSGVSVSGDVGSFAVDLKRSAFEMRISRKFLEDKLGTNLGKVYVFVASAKPGEPIGAWGEWAHTFDPDDPGGPGEGVGG